MASRTIPLIVSRRFHDRHGTALAREARVAGIELEALVLPADPEGRIDDGESARAEVAFFSQDVYPTHSRQFFSATRKAPGLKWMHVFNVGVDHPVYATVLERGARLTTSAGSTAEPIAQTAIAGLLMLARPFGRWLPAQRARRWEPLRADYPRDLPGQVALILGLGQIGREIARLAQALGMHVIGARRSPRRADDPVDELHAPEALDTLLARADFLIVACPLTPETRGLVDAARLARLPRGARVINVGRGEIVIEPDLIAALQSGHVAGAYLDVFGQEPLPAESPLWSLPNVFVTPHNSAASSGNEGRVIAIFLDNLRRYARGEPLVNEVRAP